MAKLIDEAIKPDPSGKIILVEVDGTSFGSEILRFHYCPIPHSPEEIIAADGDTSKLAPKSIWWNDLEFRLWPFQVDNIVLTTEQQEEPKLSVANLNGVVGSMCNTFEDMVGAKVRIIQTYARFLDARNFPGGNTDASPSEAYIQSYLIDRKDYIDDEVANFVLTNPADFQGVQIPTRQITAFCQWQSRGQYRLDPCNYAGTRYFDEKGNPVSDPALDKCGGCLQDCQKRFGSDAVLPFGGFPAAQLINR